MTQHARYEHEAIEVVAQRLARRDQLRRAQALAIPRTLHVTGQRDRAAVGANFVDGHCKVGIGLVDCEPRRQLEEAADFRVALERRSVIDELLAAQRMDQALIRQRRRIDDRFDRGYTDVARIVDVLIGFTFRLRRPERAGCEHVRRIRRGVQVVRPRLSGDRVERVRVAPLVGIHDVVRDALLQELRLRAALHRPRVPVQMQLRNVDEARRPEGQATELRLRCARAGVIPRADDQVVPCAPFGICSLHVLPIVLDRARLIAVVAAGDRQDRNRQLRVLLGRRVVAVPIRIDRWMREPLLEGRQGIADDLVELLERRAGLEPLAIPGAPERVVAEDAVLRGVTAGERQPLHQVRRCDVAAHRKVDAGVRRSDRHDRRQVRRKFLGGGPLVVARIRPAPHRDLAVAIRLLGQPFDHVVTVARFLDERPELAFGVTAAANVDSQERIAIRREVDAAVVVALRNVRRQGEDAGSRLLLLPRRVHRCVQLDAIAQRDLHAPLELHPCRIRRRRRSIGQ